MGKSAATEAIVRRMLVSTAGNNYLLARHAHFHRLDVDFWWLSLHAVEKYLKAMLLLNSRLAKKGALAAGCWAVFVVDRRDKGLARPPAVQACGTDEAQPPPLLREARGSAAPDATVLDHKR